MNLPAHKLGPSTTASDQYCDQAMANIRVAVTAIYNCELELAMQHDQTVSDIRHSAG